MISKTRDSVKTKPQQIDFGQRKISRMNFSYIVTIPKSFVHTPYGEIKMVGITMLEDGCLKLTPIREKNEPDEFAIM